VVLTPTGRRAASDIVTPNGVPVLTLNAGLLFVNVLDADTGLVIREDGSIRTIHTNDPSVPIRDQGSRPTRLPPDPREKPGDNPQGGTRPDPTRRTGVATATGRTGTGRTGTPTGTGGPTGTGTVGPTGTTTTTVSTTTTTAPPPTTPSRADYTPTDVAASARGDRTILVAWTPPPRGATSYRIYRTDNDTVVGTEAGGATSTILSGLPLGQRIAFVVEAVTPAGDFRSAASNDVSAYGQPGAPNVTIQLVARTPNTVTLSVMVDVVSDGGSPITSYDITVSRTSGQPIASAVGVSMASRPYQATATCTSIPDICLSGGDVTATATLNNQAGAGPSSAPTVNVGPPPPFNVNENVAVMMVSAGGKCFDRGSMSLQNCNGSPWQFWTPKNTGDLTSAVDAACLEHRQRTRLGITAARDDECRNREDSVRWVHLGGGNERHFRGEGLSRCIAVLGDPSADFTPVNLANCALNDSDRWFLYKQQPGVPMAAAARPAGLTGGQSGVDSGGGGPAGGGSAGGGSAGGEGGLGGSVAILLFGPLAIALARQRLRRRAG
jgi:hypothetical protein